MFNKISFLFYLLIFSSISLCAQIEIFDVRDFGMGSSSVGSEPINIISKNPSVQPKDDKHYISCHAINNYSIKELSPLSVKYQHKFGDNNCLLAGVGKMGNKYYSQQYLEAGISKYLGPKLSAGIRINYNEWIVSESNIKSNKTWIPEFGIFSNPFQNFFFGVIVRNPVRFRMTTIAISKEPAEINSGISYKVSEKIVIAGSVLQVNNQPLSIHGGLEYSMHKRFFLRCGICNEPLSQSFGFSIKFSGITMDMGLRTNPFLGNSTAMSLTFAL